MKKDSAINSVMKILAVVSLFVAIIGFLFNFVAVEVTEYNTYSKVLEKANVKVNGFLMVLGDTFSYLMRGEEIKDVTALIVIVKIIFVIALSLPFVYMFSKDMKDEKKKGLLEFILVIIAFSVTLLLFIIALVAKSKVEMPNYSDVKTTTATYIPFIINALITITYFILKFAIKKEKESNFIQEINKYFELKVSGLISEEEYKLFKSELIEKFLNTKKPDDTIKFIIEIKTLFDNKAITESEFNKIKAFAL